MRAAIFIDGGYFLKAAQEAGGVQPRYEDLVLHLLKPLAERPLDLMRCYFYYCPPYMSAKPTDDEKRRMADHERFLERLHKINRWQFREGKLEKRLDGDKEVFAQKRVDVLLSVDLVRHSAAGHIQHAILVAGDSDFIPAVNAAKESGVTITLWCTKKNAHRDLIETADEVHELAFARLPKDKESSRKSSARSRTVSKVAKPAARTTRKKASSSEAKTTTKTTTKKTAVRKRSTTRKKRSTS